MLHEAGASQRWPTVRSDLLLPLESACLKRVLERRFCLLRHPEMQMQPGQAERRRLA